MRVQECSIRAADAKTAKKSSTTSTQEGDRALVSACLRGSNPAWAELVATHRRGVRFAIVRTLDRFGQAPAEEVVEDLEAAVFLRLALDDFRRLRQFRGQCTLAGWLKVAAANATVDHLRRLRPTVSLSPGEGFDVPSRTPDPEVALAHRQLLEQLHTLWAELGSADLEFIEFYYVRELSFDEISRRTGCTPLDSWEPGAAIGAIGTFNALPLW